MRTNRAAPAATLPAALLLAGILAGCQADEPTAASPSAPAAEPATTSAAPTPSPSPSAPAPTSTPTPAGPPAAYLDPAFRDGEVPSPNGLVVGWGLRATCGMPVEDLMAQTTGEAVLRVTGEAARTDGGWTLPVEIVSADPVDLGRPPVLAWVQDGRLVDLTVEDVDGGDYASLAGGGQVLEETATSELPWGCGDLTEPVDAEDPAAPRPHGVVERPAGDYEVLAVMPAGQGFLMSEVVPVTIG